MRSLGSQQVQTGDCNGPCGFQPSFVFICFPAFTPTSKEPRKKKISFLCGGNDYGIALACRENRRVTEF